MIGMGANPTKVKEYLLQVSGKVVEIRQVLAQSGHNLFQKRTKQLKQIVNAWKDGHEVEVVYLGNESIDNHQNKEGFCGNIHETVSSPLPPFQQRIETESVEVLEDDQRVNIETLSSQLLSQEIDADKIPTGSQDDEYSSLEALPLPSQQQRFDTEEPCSRHTDDEVLFGEIPEALPATSQSQELTTESSSLPCSELLFPRAFKSRGRPKGATLTCLGMPSKHCKSISFASKPTREKQKLMLQWLFGSGQDYNISNIQSVPSQFLDGQVQECLYLLKDFLDLNVLKEMINKCCNEEWMCGTCSNDLRDVRSVSCDSYLKWFHFSCAGIKRPPSKKEWFCKACRK
ncbi:hypothetical protein HELRODRAFT_168080 [Helobdella robusta]|uniref:Zinc finger PHD-type domain-containing protein n=1 Tax=Helobdella robusta TaxID=6412 RepID=T1F053_HELRO|nr:hypothetical protein HELRODRAFT_168080 [Helobdella robusta]ESO10202.1 hypothetical protein HELRODRAFT_168080 [Helobdella robusta]